MTKQTALILITIDYISGIVFKRILNAPSERNRIIIPELVSNVSTTEELLERNIINFMPNKILLPLSRSNGGISEGIEQ